MASNPKNTPLRKSETLDSRTKAALILVALGEDVSSLLLSHLAKDETLRILSSLKRLKPHSPELQPESIDAVIEEFLEILEKYTATSSGSRLSLGPSGTADFLKKLAQKLPAHERDSLIHAQDSQSSSLTQTVNRLSTTELVAFLSKEHPQTVALVLAHLEPDRGAKLLKALPGERLQESLVRLARLGSVTTQSLEDLENGLLEMTQKNLAHSGPSKPWPTEDGGYEKVAHILGNLNPNARDALLLNIKNQNPELHQKVVDKLFQWKDLIRIETRDIARMIPLIPSRKLLLALKGSPPEIKNHWLKSMSTRSQKSFEEDLSNLPLTKMSEIHAAQHEILEILKEKIASGDISWKDPSEVYV